MSNKKIKALVYLPLKPEKAKALNLPLKLPIRAEDLPLIADKDRIPLDVIVRGLEEQVKLEKDDYYTSYLVYFYYEKAKELLSSGDYSAAMDYVEKAGALIKDYRYHFYRGLIFTKTGREKEAEVELKLSTGLNERFSLAHYELGKLYMKQGELDDAEKHFKKALEIDQDFILPMVGLGDVQLSRGELEAALESYQKALEKDQNLPDVYNRIGVIMNTLQRFEEAKMYFEKAIKILPSYDDAKFNLAFTLSRLGHHFKSLEILLELEKSHPDDPAVLNELGITMRELGLFEESTEKLEKALRLSPNDEGIKLNFGRSLLFVDKERALEVLKEIEGENRHLAENLIEYSSKSVELNWLEGLSIEGESILEIVNEMASLSIEELLEFAELEDPDLSSRRDSILEGYIPKQESDIDTMEFLEEAFLWILGARDFIDMERRSIVLASSLYGSGRMLAVMRILLRMAQMRIEYGKIVLDDLLESVVPELQDLDWHFALKISRYMNAIPSYEPKTATDFMISLLNFLESNETPEKYELFLKILR